MLTLQLKGCSETSIMTGHELGFADSGKLLRKKSVKFSQLRPSLDAPLHREDPEHEALLLDTFVELKVVTINGGLEELR
jgi:hypothetical protein